MASFKMTQGISRVPEDVFVENGMTVTSGGLTVTAGGLTVTAGATTLGGSLTRDLVTLTATGAITQATHAGCILLMGEVGGDAAATFTLPAATGTGAEYKFIVSVVNTSNYVIQVTGDDTIDGSVVVTNDTAAGGTASLISWPTVAATDTITLNGTTQGGVQIGDYVLLTDIATDQYTVSGLLNASGTEATPFSAAVS
jgi:hypothetical protein|tara:strand:- start:2696 stop:3289 length:594 start_codon:yes stop_codon:yes gene_type:complete